MKSRHLLLALTGAVLAFAPAAGGAASGFNGDVCALVTPAAVTAADVSAPCVQSRTLSNTVPRFQVWVATWGSATADHYMAVQVGPPRVAFQTRPNQLFPRGPGKPLGPWMVTPAVKAYWTQSAFKGTAGGRGTMKFVKGGHLLQITIQDATANVLPALKMVAKSVAAHI
jgi:hypothetical protein